MPKKFIGCQALLIWGACERKLRQVMKKNENPTLEQVIGTNVRLACEEAKLTQDDLARLVRRAGLRWTRSTVSALWNGEKSLDVEELVVLSRYLTPAPYLLGGTGSVRVAAEEVELAEVRTALGTPQRQRQARSQGGQLTAKDAADFLAFAEHVASAQEVGEAEAKAARKLGVSAADFEAAALKCWGRSLTAERDARVTNLAPPDVAPRSRQALRGRVTRHLLTELVPILSKSRNKRRR